MMQCLTHDQTHGLLFDDVIDSLPAGETVENDRTPPSLSEVSDHRLSTIPEETSRPSSSRTSTEAQVLFMQHFAHASKDDAAELLELCEYAVNEDPSTYEIAPFDSENTMFCDDHEEPFDLESHLMFEQAEHCDAAEVDSTGKYIETFVEPDIAPYFADNLSVKSKLLLQIYLGADAKKEVIDRDTDLMTAEEQIAHKKEVDEAILSE